MQWNRSNTIGLARTACCSCQGGGLRLVYKNHYTPCGCVLRAVFRACLNHFRECSIADALSGTVSWEFCAVPGGCRSYSRKREEFMADFCLIGRRVLDDVQHSVFRYYFVLDAGWRACARALGMDRTTLFHAIYAIEKKLGRAFAETEPYALYPIDEYFGGAVRTPATAAAIQAPAKPRAMGATA